ncbi:PREDICTED: miraculin-like [Nelumbo nucifera]|uniref:Miraculin-like n=2 Tax=Nelumbo nucifera TaxID=4432 RepID=A0A1U7ZMD3_NELNU|nr:PREDICTED: miraculin-like [Nelumbo nucifera]DAD35936.1 TPA_asm: hypothetical protein HUJ06_006576 [Nelumbo nucifera]
MRTTAPLLLPVFLLALATTWPPVVVAAAPEAVRDTMGRPLHSRVRYYILPADESAGGFGFASTKNSSSCPFGVVQHEENQSNGLPLWFYPVDPKKGIIRVSTDLNIRFAILTLLPQPTVWKLGEFDPSTQQWFVNTCGALGNPGPETLSSWFKIEPYEEDYKLVFCPNVCSFSSPRRFCKVICRDLGIFFKNGIRYLALSDHPLKIKFNKQ